MHKIQNFDRLIGIILLVVVCALFAETFNFKTRPYVPLNTAFWPRVVLGLLGAVALVLVVRGRVGREDHEAFAKGAAIVFVGAAAFTALLTSLGFLAASGLAVAAGYVWLSNGCGPKTVLSGAVFGTVSAIAVFALFKFALKVQLPEGSLF